MPATSTPLLAENSSYSDGFADAGQPAPITSVLPGNGRLSGVARTSAITKPGLVGTQRSFRLVGAGVPANVSWKVSRATSCGRDANEIGFSVDVPPGLMPMMRLMPARAA